MDLCSFNACEVNLIQTREEIGDSIFLTCQYVCVDDTARFQVHGFQLGHGKTHANSYKSSDEAIDKKQRKAGKLGKHRNKYVPWRTHSRLAIHTN